MPLTGIESSATVSTSGPRSEASSGLPCDQSHVSSRLAESRVACLRLKLIGCQSVLCCA